MKLFINDGVYERRWNDNVRIKEKTFSELELSIPNYLESERRHERIKLIFSNISEKNLINDLLLDQVSIKKTSKNTYHVEQLEEEKETHMYALLRSTECVPDDIFIPVSMKDKVEVIRRIRFVDDEVDYGDFLSNVYLIKIKLDIGESLPVYLTYDEPQTLQAYYVFYHVVWNEEYYVTEKFKTLILLNKKNEDEYISLSKLCE